jgi:H2-forming N5,N10-methylenetetrahydromethanopterin dehydrogenase-like enzyme
MSRETPTISCVPAYLILSISESCPIGFCPMEIRFAKASFGVVLFPPNVEAHDEHCGALLIV